MKEREELRLCTDFADLSAGMLVQLMPCGCCGSSHRSMLLGPLEHAANGLLGWDLSPPPACIGERVLCTSLSVINRRVYIVVTGNDDEAEQAQGKLDESIRDSRRVRYEDVK